MLFRRRKKLGFFEKTRIALWPSRSFSRSFQYFTKRVLRLTATPYAIAIGVAAGAFASCTPFLGFHFVISFALAWILRGNMVAAALGTAYGNPITFPFFWAVTYKIGNFILGVEQARPDHHVNLYALFRHLDMSQLWQPILKPMLVGAIPLGLVSGLAFYIFTYWSVSVFQIKRRERMARKAQARIDNMSRSSPA